MREGSCFPGIIYIHRILDNRFSGITGRNFSQFGTLCGEPTLKNVVIVTNMWTGDSQDTNEAREKELSDKYFKLALDRGAQMVRHYNTTRSTRRIIRRIIKNRPVALRIQRELAGEWRDFTDNAAVETPELTEQVRQHQVELEKLRKEMM